jgi:beta-galactosidase GanA
MMVSAPVFDRLQFGVYYNPEEWAPDVWDEDVRLMKAAGVTIARWFRCTCVTWWRK